MIETTKIDYITNNTNAKLLLLIVIISNILLLMQIYIYSIYFNSTILNHFIGWFFVSVICFSSRPIQSISTSSAHFLDP